MATAKTWIQDVFHGGENDLLPANEIGTAEVVKLVNLLPGDEGQPLKVRGGAPILCDLGLAEPLNAIYHYKRTNAAELGSSFYLVATSSSVYRITDLAAGTTVKCFDWTTSGSDTRFVTFLNRVFAFNGVDPMMYWDGSNEVWKQVTDRSGTNEQGMTLPPPRLRYAMSFRGRIWGVGHDGNVWFSGTDDAQYLIPPTTDTYYERFRVWSGTLDSDGGSANVGDDSGQSTTGLAFLYNGVVVFKERMTYLWSYSEDLHPADAKGNSIEVLIPGVGCAAHETIQYQDGAIVFLGQNLASDYSVYRLMGAGIDDVSVKIPLALRRVVANSSSRPRATIFGNYYFLAADDYDAAGSKRTLVYALDLKRKCWVEIKGWDIGGMAYSPEYDKMLIAGGSDSKIRQYPQGYVDDVDTPIAIRIKTRLIDGGNALEDHRWRNAWVDVEAVEGSMSVGTSLNGGSLVEHGQSFRVDDLDFWESDSYYVDGTGFDGSYWDDDTEWYEGSQENRINIELTSRSRTMQLDINGLTKVALAVKRVALAFKPRKLRYK